MAKPNQSVSEVSNAGERDDPGTDLLRTDGERAFSHYTMDVSPQSLLKELVFLSQHVT